MMSRIFFLLLVVSGVFIYSSEPVDNYNAKKREREGSYQFIPRHLKRNSQVKVGCSLERYQQLEGLKQYVQLSKECKKQSIAQGPLLLIGSFCMTRKEAVIDLAEQYLYKQIGWFVKNRFPDRAVRGQWNVDQDSGLLIKSEPLNLRYCKKYILYEVVQDELKRNQGSLEVVFNHLKNSIEELEFRNVESQCFTVQQIADLIDIEKEDGQLPGYRAFYRHERLFKFYMKRIK